MTEHIANDVYKLERTAAKTSARVFGWAKLVLAGM